MRSPRDQNRNWLLEAVDDLTKQRRITEWQDDPTSTDGRALRTRIDPPLLDWLKTAIGSNIGGNGGGKAARERTPMDFGAFELFEQIDGRVRAWLDELGARPGKDVTPTQMVRSWYVLWSAGQRTDGQREAFTAVIEGWVAAVRDKLDPPRKIELTSPCPMCGAEFVNIGLKLADGSDDPNDVERVRALNAVERENLDESYVLCSACDRVWKGVSQMRWLRIAIDEAEVVRTA